MNDNLVLTMEGYGSFGCEIAVGQYIPVKKTFPI